MRRPAGLLPQPRQRRHLRVLPVPEEEAQGQQLPPAGRATGQGEDGILRFYAGFQPHPERLRRLQDVVVTELRAQTADARENAERARKRHTQLLDERAKLMQAHYAGAVPLDLLTTEMERLTRAIAEAEGEVKAASTALDKIEETLHQAVSIAGRCHQLYETASPAVRRQINQGFSTKLFIGHDGEVERYELTEPFRQLLSEELAGVAVGTSQAAVDAPTGETAACAEGGFGQVNGRMSPSAVLISYRWCSTKHYAGQ